MGQIEKKVFKVKFQEINEIGEFTAYISTKSIDSYNDKVLPTAFKRTIDHNKGRVPILWMHDSSKPIGVSTHMVVEKDGVKAYGKLNLDVALGKEVYSGMKFDPPYIDRTSIGFISVDDEYDSKTNIRTIKELKLLEFSLITKNFAANSDALVAQVKQQTEFKIDINDRMNILESRLENLETSVDEMKKIMESEESEDPENYEEEIEQNVCGSKKPKKEKCNCGKKIHDDINEANSSETLSLSLGETLLDTLLMEERSVSGDSNLPIASKEHSWDGPAAKKRIFNLAGGDDFDPAIVKKAFFYFDPANEKLKTSYKLPFADVIEGKLTVVPKALSTVKGALDGARGTGVDIPAVDKEKIKSKISAYEKRMGKEKSALDFEELLKVIKQSIKELS